MKSFPRVSSDVDPVHPARGLGIEARIFIAALAFRVLSALVALLANLTFPPYRDQGFSVLNDDHPFWDTFARWDAGWYHGIASKGYVYGAGGRNNLAFFPVYPMLMRAGGWALGGRQEDYYFAGIVISWLAFAAAMTMLYRLALLDLPQAAALRAVMYAAVFPFAFYFGLVYSESVFLLTLVTATYAFRTRAWPLGAAAGSVMTATRVTGIVALPGLAWVAWQAAGREMRTRATALAACAGCASGIGAYCVFNYLVSGTPFAWYNAITFWDYRPGGNPFDALVGVGLRLVTQPYLLAYQEMAKYDTLNALAAVGSLVLVPIIWWRFNFGYAAIVLAGLLLPLSSGQLVGLGRYASVQFPVALALATFRGETRHHVLLMSFAMLYALTLAMFVTVHPLY